MSNYDFFQNTKCEYFPCHKTADASAFSCLFCYCPLYALGEKCGGAFRYTDSGIKDCSECLIPHRRENYSMVCAKMKDVLELARKKPTAQSET